MKWSSLLGIALVAATALVVILASQLRESRRATD
jgi:hypothetical protein